jgi:hypothetical protein
MKKKTYTCERYISVFTFDDEYDMVEWEDVLGDEKGFSYVLGKSSVIVYRTETKKIKQKLVEEFQTLKQYIQHSPELYLIPDSGEQ